MDFHQLYRKINRKLLFTTPTHSQRFCVVNKFQQFYKYDISETECHDPEQALACSEKMASSVYHTRQTLYLTNGSTSGVIAGVLALTERGDSVLISDSAHPCHKNAVELAGCSPVFYNIPKVNGWGINDKTTAELLEPYLKQNKIKLVIVTSPTYYGVVSDIKSIKELCRRYGAYLLVDEAHGALYPFSDRLPETSIKYSDITVQSLHKTAGGLNPTALLHSNCEVDVKLYLNKINTTSPSYPILYSIESNIKFLNSSRGKKRLDGMLDSLERLRAGYNTISFYGDDLTKLVIRKEGMSGLELSSLLYDRYNIEDEIMNECSTMLLCGIGTGHKKLMFLEDALRRIDRI